MLRMWNAKQKIDWKTERTILIKTGKKHSSHVNLCFATLAGQEYMFIITESSELSELDVAS